MTSPRAFTTLTAVAAPLLRANVDTDAIIPSREIRAVGRQGLAQGLFAGWRYLPVRDNAGDLNQREPNPNFILNRAPYRTARILLAGANFGCGSSREHAVWALHEFGFRAILAPSFAPIFFGNCVRNGILAARLDEASIARIASEIQPDPGGRRATVDLRAKLVSVGDSLLFEFQIDTEARTVLLSGLDPIEVTLKSRAAIERFTLEDRIRRPWVYLESQT